MRIVLLAAAACEPLYRWLVQQRDPRALIELGLQFDYVVSSTEVQANV
ncbi:MAG: hypothetical protein OXJ37_22415 [Bryobacterales bacterium]|nr:hypothetical protein [Bryobacterales bacterium]MDE0620935.1 hypothetical protein [Bryobacterales bacterium]